MATADELRRVVFNLKMRCHGYEQRLKEVGLHGLSGEELQRRNGELEDHLQELRQAITARDEEVKSYKALIVKSRDAMCRLEESNRALKKALDGNRETEARLKTKAAECDGLRNAVAQGQRDRVALGETQAELAALRLELATANAEAAKSAELKADLAAATAANAELEARFTAERERGDRLQAEAAQASEEARAAARAMEQAQRQHEMELEHERHRLGLAGEEAERRLGTERLALERELAETRSLLADAKATADQATETAAARLAELEIYRDQVAQCRAEIATQSELEAQHIRAAEEALCRSHLQDKDELHAERADLIQNHVREMARERKATAEQAAQAKALKESVARLKSDHKARMTELQDKYDRLRARWESSITAKRRAGPATAATVSAPLKENARPGSSSKKSPARARTVVRARATTAVAAKPRPSFR